MSDLTTFKPYLVDPLQITHGGTGEASLDRTVKTVNSSYTFVAGDSISSGGNPIIVFDPGSNNATVPGMSAGAWSTTHLSPTVVAYDSKQNAVWVLTQANPGYLSKFDATGGGQIGVDIPVGGDTSIGLIPSIAYDVTQNYIWITWNYASTFQGFDARYDGVTYNDITFHNVTTIQSVAPYGGNGIAYDIHNNAVWVISGGAGSTYLQKFDASGAGGGSPLTSLLSGPGYVSTSTGASALVYDITQNAVWVTCFGTSHLQKFSATNTGSLISDINTLTGSGLTAVAYDVTQNAVWCTNGTAGVLLKYNAAVATQIGSNINTGSYPAGVTYDFTNNFVWVVNSSGGTLQQFNAVDASFTNMPVVTLSTLTSPTGITYDSTQQLIWIASQSTNNLQAFRAVPIFPVGAQIDLIQNSGVAVTILFDPDVTVNSLNNALTTGGQYSSASLIQLGANLWDFVAVETTTATSLQSATTIVNVSSSAAPTIGQVLTATDSTNATWQSPIRTINPQTDVTYQFVLSDANSYGGDPLVTFNNASPVLVTVPLNSTVAFPVGAQIDCVQDGAGKVTFVGEGGVTINSLGSNLSIGGQYVGVSLIQNSPDTWYLLGNLIA